VATTHAKSEVKFRSQSLNLVFGLFVSFACFCSNPPLFASVGRESAAKEPEFEKAPGQAWQQHTQKVK
jgi:hypothetical protein